MGTRKKPIDGSAYIAAARQAIKERENSASNAEHAKGDIAERLKTVLQETQREFDGVREQLRLACFEVAEATQQMQQDLFLQNDLREPHPLHRTVTVNLDGIVKGKGTEVDALCARYATLKVIIERLKWAMGEEQQ